MGHLPLSLRGIEPEVDAYLRWYARQEGPVAETGRTGGYLFMASVRMGPDGDRFAQKVARSGRSTEALIPDPETL